MASGDPAGTGGHDRRAGAPDRHPAGACGHPGTAEHRAAFLEDGERFKVELVAGG
jgi:hypothetical protein